MKDMMIGLAFMGVYLPFVGGYIFYGEAMIEKVAEAIESFLWPVKAEPKVHGDLIAMFGEAVDA